MAAGDERSDITLQHNIILVDARAGLLGVFGSTWLGNSSFRQNLYWNASGGVLAPAWPGFPNGTHCPGWRHWSKRDRCSLPGAVGVNNRSFAQWRATGQDLGSLVAADPSFARAVPTQPSDFKLSATSPALSLGFNPDLVTAVARPALVGPAAQHQRPWSLPGCPSPTTASQPPSCGPPLTPTNGSLSGNGVWRCGDLVVWHCEPGFLLTGATYAVCLATGWSDAAPQCVPLPTPPPPKCLASFGGVGVYNSLSSTGKVSKMQSPDASHDLVMQSDGDLCIYTHVGGFPSRIWCTGSNQSRPAVSYTFVMQGDGNACVYPALAHPQGVEAGGEIWCSGTAGCTKPPCSFWAALSDTGEFCVHEGDACVANAPTNGARWCSSQTFGAGHQKLSG